MLNIKTQLEILYYFLILNIHLCLKNNYSYKELKRQIRSHYYERYLLSNGNALESLEPVVGEEDESNVAGFSPRNLSRMRKFNKTYRDLSNLPMPLAKLPWSFNCLLLDKVEDIVKRIWYAKECLNNGLSQIPTNTEDRSLNNTPQN